MYRVGISREDSVVRLDGYSKARDKKATAAGANTQESQRGYGLSKVGVLGELATCSAKNSRAGDSYFLKAKGESVLGWKLPPETKPER